jgi:hypothetical protein
MVTRQSELNAMKSSGGHRLSLADVTSAGERAARELEALGFGHGPRI